MFELQAIELPTGKVLGTALIHPDSPATTFHNGKVLIGLKGPFSKAAYYAYQSYVQARYPIYQEPHWSEVGDYTIASNFPERVDNIQYVKKPIKSEPVQMARKKPFEYSVDHLNKMSEKAGVALYGHMLEHSPWNEIEHVNMSDLVDSSDDEEGADAFDDYEYVFHPSTGRGFNVASTAIKDITQELRDPKTGHVYTHHPNGGAHRVIHIDMPLSNFRNSKVN